MTPRRLFPACAMLALLAALPARPAGAVDAPYAEGQRVIIQGRVTDRQGTPQAGKTVELEVYRRSFSFDPRRMGRAKKGLEVRSTTTGADGRYALEWPWFDYFNRFELAVGGFVGGAYQVAERVDLSRRILEGSPVVVDVALGGPGGTAAGGSAGATGGTTRPATPVTPYDPPPRAVPPAAAEDTGLSAAQEQVRARQGSPDRIETLDLPYGVEVTWWYFSRGRAYRFLDGELREEMTFDPVPAE